MPMTKHNGSYYYTKIKNFLREFSDFILAYSLSEAVITAQTDT